MKKYLSVKNRWISAEPYFGASFCGLKFLLAIKPLAGTSGPKGKKFMAIQFEPEIRTGPCLRGCGQRATYELVDPETERQRATCPSCGVYYEKDIVLTFAMIACACPIEAQNAGQQQDAQRSNSNPFDLSAACQVVGDHVPTASSVALLQQQAQTAFAGGDCKAGAIDAF